MTNRFEFAPFDGDALEKAGDDLADWSRKFADTTLTMLRENSAISQEWAQQSIDHYSRLVDWPADPASFTRHFTKTATDGLKSSTMQLAAYADVARRAQAAYLDLFFVSSAPAQSDPAKAVEGPAAHQATPRATVRSARSA